MLKLRHKNSQHLIVSFLTQALGLKQRVQGLLFRSSLEEQEALWIAACPSIHTFFMKFSIDVIFTDRKFRVLSLFENVVPWKLIFGKTGSYHVFEMKAGKIKIHKLKLGDELYVEH